MFFCLFKVQSANEMQLNDIFNFVHEILFFFCLNFAVNKIYYKNTMCKKFEFI